MSEIIQEDKVVKSAVTVARNGGTAILGSFGSNVIRFLTQVVLGRALGAERYGLYSLGISLFSVVGQSSLVGLPEGIVKFGVVYGAEKDQSRLKGLINLAMLFAVVVGTTAAISMFLLAPYIAENIFHKSESTIIIRLFALSIPFYVFAAISAAAARAMQNIFYYTSIQFVLHPLIYLACIIIFLFTGLTINKSIECFILAWIIVFIYSVIVIFKICPVLRSKVKPIYEPKQLFRFTIPVFLAGFSTLIIGNFDRLILGSMVPASEIGIYNAGIRIATQTILIKQAFNLIFAPTIAELYHDKKLIELNSLFKTVTNWTVSLTIPIVLWIFIFPKPIMNLFGADFVYGTNILILCCLAQLINVCTGPVENILIMTGKQDLHLINNFTSAILNIILNIFLVKKYGILGAALALGISLVIVSLVRLSEVYIFNRLYPYSIKLLKSFWAAFVTGSLVLMLNNFLPFGNVNWLVASVFLFIGYILFICLMSFDDEDSAVLALVKRKVGGYFVKCN